MKLKFLFAMLGICGFVFGCKALLGTAVSPSSLPVSIGAATNGTPELVAWLQTASAINAAANPTPTSPAIASLLGAITTLASAAAGWYARHISTTPKA